jgi:hypothetical protein
LQSGPTTCATPPCPCGSTAGLPHRDRQASRPQRGSPPPRLRQVRRRPGRDHQPPHRRDPGVSS